ncbi:membrane protein [Clostridium botulinum B str. Eklund 17B (NRP)]|nr:membrane protein [Clostridium botulinum B str. Eklund 17B (NRP)]
MPIVFGIILSDLIFGRYKERFMESYYLVQKVSVKEYLIGFGVDFGLTAIVGIIIYIIIKKNIKKASLNFVR